MADWLRVKVGDFSGKTIFPPLDARDSSKYSSIRISQDRVDFRLAGPPNALRVGLALR
jgi:hypothetical protein